MTDLDAQRESSSPAAIRFWQRIPVVIRAIVLGLLVSLIGVYAWPVIAMLIPSFWSIIVMSGVLLLYWKYFSGSWWSKATAEARANSFRAAKLSLGVWKWGLVGAVLFVVLVQSSLVMTFRIIEFPAAEFTSGFNFDALPLGFAWLAIVMSSLVAGICEETGFRGYMQVPLEKRYGPKVGITIVSIMFAVFHLQQAWALPILFHLFAIGALLGILAYVSGSLVPSIIGHAVLDIFNFSYWWSDVAGKFERRTILETGIDFHFVGWFLILGASIVVFFVVVRRIRAVRQQI